MFTRHGHTDLQESHEMQVDLKPFINFLVVLIPVLMLSAEFSKIAVVSFATSRQGGRTDTVIVDPPPPSANTLQLTIFISESTLTIGSQNGFLPSLYYKEFHSFAAKGDRNKVTVVEVNPASPSNMLAKDVKQFQKQEILLYSKNPSTNAVVRSLYLKNGNVPVVNNEMKPVASFGSNDAVYLLDNAMSRAPANIAGAYEMRPLSAYDELKCGLLKMRNTYKGLPGCEDITIAANNKVVYDKIIQIMDVARETGFVNVSISKVRG
jgi:biopolymer transport protein ExbD